MIMTMMIIIDIYLVIISESTNEFLPGDNTDLLNWIRMMLIMRAKM